LSELSRVPSAPASQHSDGLADAGGGPPKLPEAAKLPYLEIMYDFIFLTALASTGSSGGAGNFK